MAIWKVTFQMNLEKQGFSETYYVDLTSESALRTQIQNVAALRIACLPQRAYMQCWKYSNEAVVGDSYADFDIQWTAGQALPGGETGDALLCRLMAGSLYRRLLLLRCLPDDWIFRNANGQLTWSNIADTNVKAFLQSLVTNSWKLKVITKTGDGVTEYPILALGSSLDPRGTTITSTMPANTVAVGEKVQLRKCKEGAEAANGIWVVKKVEAGTGVITIPLDFTEIDTTDPLALANATVRKIAYKYESITDTKIEDVRNRKPGRAFFVPAGRRRVR